MNEKLLLSLLKFTIGLFGRIPSDNENRMISPLSVNLALSLLMSGAGEETEKVFLNVFGEGMTADEYRSAISSYLKEIPEKGDAVLKFANSVWAEKDLHMKYKFSMTNRNAFQAYFKRLSFDADAVASINKWVDKSTDGMIDRIIDTLSPLDKLVLINALAFKGDWVKAFDENETAAEDFTNADGTRSMVKGMHGTAELYMENNECSGFLKPYQGGRYAFAAFLPNENVPFEQFEQNFDVEKYLRLVAGASERETDIMLPKFTSEYTVTMNPYLKELGLGDALSNGADYSGISDTDFTVGEILHKTFIDVNETGTRAAAVTAILMKGMASRKPRVILNRPFIYAIIDRKYGLPVFIGDIVRF